MWLSHKVNTPYVIVMILIRLLAMNNFRNVYITRIVGTLVVMLVSRIAVEILIVIVAVITLKKCGYHTHCCNDSTSAEIAVRNNFRYHAVK